jgi:CheY-like chemotaxis protein
MPSILIADDDECFRNFMKSLVEDLGHTPALAKDGVEALKLAKELQPHLIVVDVQMPEMDGIELNTHLRLDSRTEGIPILIMTGNDFKHMEIGVTHAFTMRFEYILSKRATVRQISEKISEILERYYQL